MNYIEKICQFSKTLIVLIQLSGILLLNGCSSLEGNDENTLPDSGANNEYNVNEEPLQIESLLPGENATEVPLNTAIAVHFSKPVNPESIVSNIIDSQCLGNFQVSADNFSTCIPMQTEPVASNENRSFTVNPTATLNPGTLYQVKISSDVQDETGNFFGTDYISDGFTTVPQSNPDSIDAESLSVANDENIITNTLDFNIDYVIPINSNSIEISFSTIAAAESANPENYCIAEGKPLTCLSTELAIIEITFSNENTVRLLTGIMKPGQNYRIFLAGITGASAGQLLNNNSADFIGYSPFEILSAKAISSASIQITFSEELHPDSTQNISNYCIEIKASGNCPLSSDLAIAEVSMNEKIARLKTAEHEAGILYSVIIIDPAIFKNATIDKSLENNKIDFSGYNIAMLKITEVFIDDTDDKLEFIVTRKGVLTGITIYIKDRLRYTFPATPHFSKGRIIVFHAQKGGLDELNNDPGQSVDADNTIGFDFWQAGGGSIISTDGEIELRDLNDNHQDYLAYTDGAFGIKQQERVSVHVSSGHWSAGGDGLSEYDLIDSGKDNGSGLCLQRLTDSYNELSDTNSKTDWLGGICDLGTYQVITVPEFNITSARSISETEVQITFSRAADVVSLNNIVNYCITDASAETCSENLLGVLEVAQISQNSVTLITDTQASGRMYKIFAAAISADGDGALLNVSEASFRGNPVAIENLLPGDLLITEINYDIDTALGFEGSTETLCTEKDDEFIEIYNNSSKYVNLTGGTIQYGTSGGNFSTKYTFGDIGLDAGNTLVIIANDAGCYTSATLINVNHLFKGSAFSFSAGGATFALVVDTTALADGQSGPAIESGSTVVLDYVGTAAKSLIYEGSDQAPDCDNSSSIRTIPNVDTNDNLSDFSCGISNGTPGY